jgi:hypothetical protein
MPSRVSEVICVACGTQHDIKQWKARRLVKWIIGEGLQVGKSLKVPFMAASTAGRSELKRGNTQYIYDPCSGGKCHPKACYLLGLQHGQTLYLIRKLD